MRMTRNNSGRRLFLAQSLWQIWLQAIPQNIIEEYQLTTISSWLLLHWYGYIWKKRLKDILQMIQRIFSVLWGILIYLFHWQLGLGQCPFFWISFMGFACVVVDGAQSLFRTGETQKTLRWEKFKRKDWTWKWNIKMKDWTRHPPHPPPSLPETKL